MFNAFFIYQDLDRDTSAFPAVEFSVLKIKHSNFEQGVTKFKYSAGGVTLKFHQKSYHVSVKINNVTVRENKGITCSSIYVDANQCSSIALIMDAVTVTGGVCLTNDTSLNVGELLFVYGRKYYIPCKKKLQTVYISRGNFSKNSHVQSKHPCIHITSAGIYYTPVFVMVIMSDIILSENMGSGIHINFITIPVLLQSVFITDNLNGAVDIRHSTVTFSGITTLTHNRGKAFYIAKSNVTFTGSLYFKRNHADLECPFAAVDGSKVIFAEYTFFYSNYGRHGSLCITTGSSATFKGGRTEFIKNRGEYFAGAIRVDSSYIDLHGNMTILENLAYRGGGLSLNSDAFMIINPETYFNFTGNRALYKGGAIYVHDNDRNRYKNGGSQCFFWPKDDNQSTSHMHFQGNYAQTAGSALYGGSVDTCFLKGCKMCKGNQRFFKMAHFENSTDLSLISSDATRVCICNGSRPDCTILNITLAAYPGQTVLISAVAVGQGLGTSPATVRATFLDSGAEVVPELGELQASQVADKHCKNLSYTVSSPNELEAMVLTVKEFIPYGPISEFRVSTKS